MAYFAQQNYPQQLGAGTLVYTIAEAGCLDTAISNLLVKINGTGPDPLTLDQFFVARGDFLYDTADHTSDDLAWNSITKYDPTIVNQGVANGQMPSTSLSIVKFHYNAVQAPHAPIDHYCAVDHIEGGQLFIIDSWDGLVKSPAQYQSVYGVPVMYGTYVKNNPAPPYTLQNIQAKQVKLNKDTYRFNLTYGTLADVEAHTLSPATKGSNFWTSTIVNHEDGLQYYSEDNNGYSIANGFLVSDCDDYTPAPPSAPVAIPYADQGTPNPVVVPLKGYQNATQAGNQSPQGYVWVEPDENYVLYRYYSDTNKDLRNITKNKTVGQYWIKQSLNVTPAPPAPVISDWPISTASVPVTVTEPVPEDASTDGPNAYKTTYSTFKDNHGKAQPLYYVAEDNLPVTNFDTGKVLTIGKYVTVQISGTFMKDGLKYARPTDAANKALWYGIAMLNANGNPNLLLEDNGQLTSVERIATGRKSGIEDYITQGIYTLEKVMDIFKFKKGK